MFPEAVLAAGVAAVDGRVAAVAVAAEVSADLAVEALVVVALAEAGKIYSNKLKAISLFK